MYYVTDCAECGEQFKMKRCDQRFCSTPCNRSFHRRKVEESGRTCKEDGCDRPLRAKGLCNTHYKRIARAEGRMKDAPWDDRRRTNYHKRRASKRTTQVERIDPSTIYARDSWQCGLCPEHVDAELTWPHPMSPSLDHIQPLSLGGTHTEDNVQLAHLACNVSKGNRIAA